MATHLAKQNILLFDYTKNVNLLREEERQNAETLAAKNIFIEFIRRSNERKEDIEKKLRPNKFGLVTFLCAMASCKAYNPWRDKVFQRTFMKSVSGKCFHYNGGQRS